MRQFAFLQFPCFCIYVCNLLEARVIVTTYNQHVRLLSPEPWLVGTTQAYSGVGADIVMESISLKSPIGVLRPQNWEMSEILIYRQPPRRLVNIHFSLTFSARSTVPFFSSSLRSVVLGSSGL